ncbi:HU family DNA-binding protein [Streptomyces sp. NPDC102394]|uniref:HU family DNA-binding protein n=1 Tax=Streptomyces sp. NPDC102394 TaxID=3366167 RepID=UPI00382E97D0
MKRKPTRITQRLTTTTLIDVVAADLGTKPTGQAPVHDTVMATFDAIARANASGHDVAVTNFGTWFSYRAKAVTRRNPQNDEPIPVPAHQAVRFRVSPTLAELVRRRDRNASIRKAPKGAGKDGAK